MKKIFLMAVLFVSALSFAQNTVNGKLTDLESDNAPLMLGKVVIKETGVSTMTNDAGVFAFENLKAGNYTLVCSFSGYETKEINIEVVSGVHKDVNVALAASSISLDELMLVMASADNQNVTEEIRN